MNPEEYSIIVSALNEDTGKGDPTTEATVDSNKVGTAFFLAKEDGILSGIEYACEVFSVYAKRSNREAEVTHQILIPDGTAIKINDRLAVISAPLDIILTAERVALNILQRMCGIATMTAQFVETVRGTGATILDTRKTAPLLRPFDRYAVKSGGGNNHRYSLGDMILVKDNHIAANEMNIEQVIKKLRVYFQTHDNIPVELEVTDLEQFAVVQEFGVGIIDRVLFDNFLLEDLREGVKRNNGVFDTEASGGVNLNTVGKIAETGVKYISVGALTHSVSGLDISLEVE